MMSWRSTWRSNARKRLDLQPQRLAVSLLTCGYTSALGGIRTPNLLIRSQVLYPLSYERRCTTMLPHRSCAEAPGFEPGMGVNPNRISSAAP